MQRHPQRLTAVLLLTAWAATVSAVAPVPRGDTPKRPAQQAVKPLVHPGLLHSRADLERIKEMVAKGEEPWKSGFEKLKAHPQSQADWHLRGPFASVSRDPHGPWHNIASLDMDGNAAYQNALLWYISGDDAHARKAVEILDAWSATLQEIAGRDQELAASLAGFKFANAAEIIRATFPGWKAQGIRRCQRMLRGVFYPVIRGFAPFANGNWGAGCIKTMLAIGVFCDDRAIFDRGVDYFRHGAGNGCLTHYVINAQGQCQESGRDQTHAQLGLGHLAEACEIAGHQGIDLYAAEDNRLLKGFEYASKYNLGYEVPFVPHRDTTGKYAWKTISEKNRGSLRPIFEMVWNHYENFRGLDAPFTRQAAEKLRPEGAAFDADHPGFGTLLFTRSRQPASPHAAAMELKSPDGNVVVTAGVQDVGSVKGCLVYGVAYKGKTVLADSRLGLELADGSLSSGLHVAKQTVSRQDSTWKPVCGERDVIRDHYQQVDLDLQTDATPPSRLRLTFRAYNEGVAFCYTLPAQDGLKDFTVTAEKTGFHFTADHTAWAVYTAQGNYDGGEVPLSRIRPGVERPLTVRVADDLYASITEARLVDYARMKLRPVKDQPHTLEAFLDAERGHYGQVTGTAPFTSPWRVVLLADSPGKLLEQNYLILNLNDPCALADTSWIKPGKVIREVTLTTAGGKACVDFCVQRGMQYVEYDSGWYGPEGDSRSDARQVHLDPKQNHDPKSLDLHAVIAYGKSKGIGIILYVNQRALERQLDEILPLYEKWGVKGIKFGFVNVGSQRWTRWLHEAIRKAAQHRLMLDIHDEFRSTGYQRTYPNLMTVEGIGGNEEFPTPVHNATLPFTRFLTGPADYTFCWYSGKLKPTHAHQLALSTIYFSPWQFLYWYDRPAMYRGEAALEYWKDLPTVWDETRVLQGRIGKCASVARRKGKTWYVGTICPQGGPLEIPLAFLDRGTKYTATIYSDRNPADPSSKDVKVETLTVDSAVVLRVNIPANGGQAVRIVPSSAVAAGERANLFPPPAVIPDYSVRREKA